MKEEIEKFIHDYKVILQDPRHTSGFKAGARLILDRLYDQFIVGGKE